MAKKTRQMTEMKGAQARTLKQNTNHSRWKHNSNTVEDKPLSSQSNLSSQTIGHVPEDMCKNADSSTEHSNVFRGTGKSTKPKSPKKFRGDGNFDSEKDALIDRLKTISASSLDTAWETVKIAVELRNKFHMTPEDIMKAVGRKKTVVYDWFKAAKVSAELEETMPGHQKDLGVHKVLQIGKGYRQLPRRVRKSRSMKDFAVDCETKSAKTTRRDWATEEINKSSMENADRAKELSGTTQIGNRCKNMSCLEWMEEEAKQSPHSYRVLYSDVPYPYTSCNKLLVDQTQIAGQRVECENATYEQAMALTVGIIERAGTLLSKDDKDDWRGGGVLLLMQAGGQPVLPELLTAVDKAGLEIKFVVQIDTGHSKLANAGHPYGKSSEPLLVIKRKDDRMVRCDTRTVDQGSGAGNLLAPHTSVISERQLRKYVYQWQILNNRELYRYHPRGVIKSNASKQHVSSRWRDDYQYGETHLFQKNEAQLLLVLGKHAVAGDKIADLCGCSGSCCIAADQLCLDWTYIELSKNNYNWGISRIADYMEAKKCGIKSVTDEQLEEYERRVFSETLSSEEVYSLYTQSLLAKANRKTSTKSSSPVALINSENESSQ